MAPNPVGAVPIFDGGIPRLVSAIAAVGVTGGQLIYLSGGNNVVSSGLYSFNTGSLVVFGLASGAQFNGIVVTPGKTSSGTNSVVSIGMQGTYILPADGSVWGGYAVATQGNDAVSVLVSGTGTAGTFADEGRKIGRALTNASSGTTVQYAVVYVNP